MGILSFKYSVLLAKLVLWLRFMCLAGKSALSLYYLSIQLFYKHFIFIFLLSSFHLFHLKLEKPGNRFLSAFWVKIFIFFHLWNNLSLSIIINGFLLLISLFFVKSNFFCVFIYSKKNWFKKNKYLVSFSLYNNKFLSR